MANLVKRQYRLLVTLTDSLQEGLQFSIESLTAEIKRALTRELDLTLDSFELTPISTNKRLTELGRRLTAADFTLSEEQVGEIKCIVEISDIWVNESHYFVELNQYVFREDNWKHFGENMPEFQAVQQKLRAVGVEIERPYQNNGRISGRLRIWEGDRG
jgi:hypothetical protein